MDKESIILKHLDLRLEENSIKIEELKNRREESEGKLDRIDEKLDEVYDLLHLKKEIRRQSLTLVQSEKVIRKKNPTVSFEELYDSALQDLAERGLDPENIDYRSLVPKAVLLELEEELNRPLPRKEKWRKSDYIAVFIAASVGSLADFLLSNRNNSLTGKDSDFSKWLNQFHQHEGGAPIDYQGPGFSGGYHRGLSKGHDILRFIETIQMFKNGQFEGIRFKDGIGNKIITHLNQNGTPYQELEWIEAILKYAKHMFADLLSTCSLPFPGSSFLVESTNRDLRKLAANMYQNGFNLKNIITQSLSTILVEVILRIYFGIDSMRAFQEEFQLEEDYSNLNAFKELINPSSKEKLFEMLLLSHSIVTAVNIGKVIIKKSPWEINATEIISVVRYTVPVVKSLIERNSEFSKLHRNSDDIHNTWERLSSNLQFEILETDFSTQSYTIG